MSQSNSPSALKAWLIIFCVLPLPVLGAAAGLYFTKLSLDRSFAEEERRNPGAVCGLPALMIIPGTGLGALVGVAVGAGVAQFMRWRCGDAPDAIDTLWGSAAETCERILAVVPIGTLPEIAIQKMHDRGVECSPHVDAKSQIPFLWCVHSESQEPGTPLVWLVRIDCEEGQVSEVICLLNPLRI